MSAKNTVQGAAPIRPQKTAKFAILSHGHAGLPNRVKRSEGSNTTPTSHTRKTMSAGCTNPDFDKSEKDHAAQRGRDASGQRHA